ncbi:DnaB-like helicase C-terminal domain-containing protein [Polyangium sp. 15x6]|uniref:RAD55 family ATPase n=1 Tax=Polyangium sp. 15x6 TaxID=3042687 RepID=UPI00249B543D|nr:DnaB-like helicase C-terminal domain-containing protein [Polyangium sp. 15x6]MDI3291971.1 DnaB-like helicase C-terminal domain-containing protein [Polyangium sp. 15x6]
MNEAEQALSEARASAAEGWKTPAERARGLGARGARLPTGLATLDRATRGGPMTGRVLVVGGAPGAGKTALLVQLAHGYAGQGHPVAVLAADEEADGLLIRWGQQGGLSREALEAGDEEARSVLGARVETLPFLLVDAEEDDATVEDVAEELARRAAGRPAVLFVDSLQSARARSTGPDMMTPRERIDRVMRTLRALAQRNRLLVVATSEVSRGSYAGGSWQVNDLAAFKESGGIEYGASMALVMRCSSHEANLFEVGMPKNRLGPRLGFWLSLDPERATFHEVDAPERSRQDATGAPPLPPRERVLAALAGGRTFPNRNALVAGAGGGNRQRMLGAIAALVDEGVIEETPGCVRLAPSGFEPVPVPGSPYRGGNREP